MAYTKQKKSNKLNIAKRIKQKMAELNYTQDDIETVIGATNQSVTRWLSGKTKPQSNNLASMAELFDTTVEWLLNGDAVADSADQGDITPLDDKPAESVMDSPALSADSDDHDTNLEASEGATETAINNVDDMPAAAKEITLTTKDMTDNNEDEGQTVDSVPPTMQSCDQDGCNTDNDLVEVEDIYQINAKKLAGSIGSAIAMAHEVTQKSTKLKNKKKKKNKKKIYTMPFPANKDENKVTDWTTNIHGGATSEEGGYKSLVLSRSINVVEGQVSPQALQLVLAAKRVKKAKKQADKLAKEANKLMKSAKKAEKLSQKAANKLEAEQASLDAAQIAGARIIILGE